MKINTAKIITISLGFIWMVLIVIGILTLINPLWLNELAEPGKDVEAVSKKDYGNRFLDQQKYRQAIIQYKAALEIKPDMNSAMSNMAMAYYKLGDFKNAITIYEYLLKQNPEFEDVVHFNLAEVYEASGNAGKAIEHYRKAAAMAPDPVAAYQKAGKLLMDKGEYSEALENFTASINKRMTLENAYLTMLKRELQKDSDDAELDSFLVLQIESGSYKDRLKAYDNKIMDQVLLHDASIAKTYNNIGYCQYMLKKPQDALKSFELALKINPGLQEAAKNKRILEKRL